MKKVIVLFFALFAMNNANTQGCLPSGITFNSQIEIDNFQANFPGCTVIEGSASIGGADIVNLQGLNVLTKVAGTLSIGSNAQLTNLGGLESIDTVGNSLIISGNSSLESLGGLESLSYVGGDLKIGSNPSLTSILAGGQLGRVAVELMIANNEQLTSLSGFESLQSVGALTIMGNQQLASLSGIDNADGPAMAWVTIMSNPNLSTCDVQSICDFLSSQAGPAQIWGNASGCNDQEEVEEACGIIGIEEISHTNGFCIYPNPSRSQIIIETSAIPGLISILDLSGRLIMNRQVSAPETVIDVSSLPRGLYFVRMQDDTGVRVKKMVKD